MEGVEINESELIVRCGNNLVQPVTKKQVSRHKDCPHSQEGKLKNGGLNGQVLKKLAQFARHQKKKASTGAISTEALQARIGAYETRLLREMNRI